MSGGQPGADPRYVVLHAMDGYLHTQLLHVAAALGIADALVDGPLTSDDIAAVVGAKPAPLHRILRGLAVIGVVEEVDGDRFALTAAGSLLGREAAGSVRDASIVRGTSYYRAAEQLLVAARTGAVPFEVAHGMALFEHLARDEDDAAAFRGSMAARSEREAADVAASVDLGSHRRALDVGGGPGILLGALLRANPSLRGTLFDRSRPPDLSRAGLDRPDVAHRHEVVVGDFFEAVPRGADLHVLSRVLHDWDDLDCGRILTRCRESIEPGGRLLIVEAVIPPRALDDPAAVVMDLHMLVLTDGRERTGVEYERLLVASGFRPTTTHQGESGVSIMEAVPA